MWSPVAHWLFSVRMFLRFICVVACYQWFIFSWFSRRSRTLPLSGKDFLLILWFRGNWCNIPLYEYNTCNIHFLIDGHMDCLHFQLLWIKLLWIFVYMFLCRQKFLFLLRGTQEWNCWIVWKFCLFFFGLTVQHVRS